MQNILDFVNYWTQSPAYIGLFVGRVAVFLLLAFAFYSVIDYLHAYSVISGIAKRAVSQTSAQEKLRMQMAYQHRRDFGASEKTSFIYKIDLLILQSNIKKYIKWMNTQLFLFICLAGGVAAMLIAVVATNNSTIGITAMVAFVMAMYSILVILSNINYKKVEKGLISFANIAENFSKSSDDLVTILDRVSWYVDEPLKSAIRDCVAQAKNTGDTVGAIQQLQLRIEHPQFRQLIRNLEVASRHEANYAEIIEDNRKTLQEYIRFQQEREAIYANGRIELLGVTIASVAALVMVQDMAETSIFDLFTEGIFGTVISIYFMITAIYIIYVMFFSNTKDKSSGGDY